MMGFIVFVPLALVIVWLALYHRGVITEKMADKQVTNLLKAVGMLGTVALIIVVFWAVVIGVPFILVPIRALAMHRFRVLDRT